jgi:hypothetical protein
VWRICAKEFMRSAFLAGCGKTRFIHNTPLELSLMMPFSKCPQDVQTGLFCLSGSSGLSGLTKQTRQTK